MIIEQFNHTQLSMFVSVSDAFIRPKTTAFDLLNKFFSSMVL